MSQEPYVAFYSAVLRDLLACLDDDSLRTFFALASHIDGRGVCFPGVRQLAAIGGMPIASVFDGLTRLEAMGLLVYLRRDEHDPVTHQQLPNVYALHSGVVRVVNDIGFPALANITKKPDRYYASPPIHNQNQKQNQKQLHQAASQPDTQPESEEYRTSAAGAGKPFEGEGQGQKRPREADAAPEQAPNPSARSATSADDARSSYPPAAPREPRNLRPYREPLAHDEAEQMAMNLVAAAPDMSKENARMLTHTYGTERIARTLALYFEQPAGTVRSPARWIRKLLRRGAGDDQ